MEPDSPTRKENENPNEGDASKQKKKRYWKAFRIVAAFGIIEALSLVLWIKSEDFSPASAHFLRWFATCGFLAGGAFLAHKLVYGRFRRWKIGGIWIAWGIVSVGSLYLQSPPSTDADDNPIGLLLPANDPFPVIQGWPDAPIPTNNFFAIIGGNIVVLTRIDPVSLLRFHGTDLIQMSLNESGLSISGEFYDKAQNIYAVFETNKFVLDRPNYWRTKRPDRSTLVIINHQNTEALNIRFCRTNYIQISGKFEFEDGSEARATKTNFVYVTTPYYGNIDYGDCGIGINSDGKVEFGGPDRDEVMHYPRFHLKTNPPK